MTATQTVNHDLIAEALGRGEIMAATDFQTMKDEKSELFTMIERGASAVEIAAKALRFKLITQQHNIANQIQIITTDVVEGRMSFQQSVAAGCKLTALMTEYKALSAEYLTALGN